MLIADDPAGFLRLLQPDADRERHCRAAVRAIADIDQSRVEHLTAALVGCAIEYAAMAGSGIPISAVRKALAAAVDAARTMSGALDIVAKAVASTPRGDVDRHAQLQAALGVLVDAVYPGLPAPDWDPDATWINPHAGTFARAADRVEGAVDAIGVHLLHHVTRPRDAALDRLIARLGLLYEAASGRTAVAEGKSTDPSYRPPFARFVTKFWPAASREAVPSNRAIANALRERWSHQLPHDVDTNSGDRPEAEASS